jgi:dUTP pyrophosphatase
MYDMSKMIKDLYCIEVEVLDGGKLPFKAYATDAGFDLFATSDIELVPGQILKHPLNIKMKLPRGTYAQIESKSGLGSKGLLVYAGVIDETYRGIPHVVGANLNIHEGKPIVVKAGEKLAQMTMRPHANEYFIEQVESVDTDTDRGTGGFGSTGA